MHISQLMRDSPRTPLEKTGDWIEYVLRHGGARHLRAQVFNMPWYQYYLLDVIALLVALVTLVVMVIRLACRCIYRVCCRQSNNKTKKEWTVFSSKFLENVWLIHLCHIISAILSIFVFKLVSENFENWATELSNCSLPCENVGDACHLA